MSSLCVNFDGSKLYYITPDFRLEWKCIFLSRKIEYYLTRMIPVLYSNVILRLNPVRTCGSFGLSVNIFTGRKLVTDGRDIYIKVTLIE